MKTCPKCAQTKERNEFYRNRTTKDLMSNWCKQCTRADFRLKRSAKPELIEKREIEKLRRLNGTKFCPTCDTLKTIEEFGQKHGRFKSINAYCLVCAQRLAQERYRFTYPKLKEAVFQKYGDCCKRCGFKDRRALQIDHVNGDGAKDRRENCVNSWGWFKRVLEDTSGAFQILCANCNWIKRFELGEHRGKRNRLTALEKLNQGRPTVIEELPLAA